MKIRKVFVAGPLFSESERWLDRRIADICQSLGFKTFWSWREEEVKKYSIHRLYLLIKGEIDKCDLVVANLDGADVDSGTAWEIGYAVSKGKPVIGVRTDMRVHQKDHNVNLMIHESANKIVSSLDELRQGLIELTKS